MRWDTITSCASSVGPSVLAQVPSNPRFAPKVPSKNEESRRSPVKRFLFQISHCFPKILFVPNVGMFVPNFGILGSGIPDTGSPASRIPDPGSELDIVPIRDPSRTPDPESRIPDPGIPGSRCIIPIPDPLSGMPHPGGFPDWGLCIIPIPDPVSGMPDPRIPGSRLGGYV